MYHNCEIFPWVRPPKTIFLMPIKLCEILSTYFTFLREQARVNANSWWRLIQWDQNLPPSAYAGPPLTIYHFLTNISLKDKEDKEDKDLFMGPQEFVVGYSKAPEQPQSSARPICHSHTMTRTGREPATVRIAA